jgi:type I restriction enzyme S subunit
MSSVETKPLGQLLRRPPRYGINAAAVPLGPRVPTYLRITDIDDSGRFAPNPKVGVAHANAFSYRMAPGELVFARTGASVGKSYLYDPRDGELIYAGFLINVAPDPALLNAKFLSLLAQTKEYWDWIARTSVRSGQPGVNGREYATFPVPLLDIAVQNAIAAAMTDVDSLIAQLERLLAKKQAIKQGMMQKLLTGKTRLSGFSAVWTPRLLRDIVDTPITDGPHLTPQFLSIGVPFLSVNNLIDGRIDLTGLRYISESDNALFSRKCAPRKGDILFGKAASVGKVAFVEMDLKFNVWSPLAVIRLAPAHVPRFVYYQLQSGSILRQVALLTNSSSQGNIGMTDIGRLLINLPPRDEQNAIAAALKDIDDEIDVLRERLTKALEVKQGMMQQLLSGRVRLPAEAVS